MAGPTIGNVVVPDPSNQVEVAARAAKVQSDPTPGANELLSAQETIPADVGFEFAGATSGADIALGAAGAAGDYCGDVTIRAGASVANITSIQFKDGTVVMEALTYTTAITPSSAPVTITGPRTKSKYGGWKIVITAAGATMANIYGFARGKFS